MARKVMHFLVFVCALATALVLAGYSAVIDSDVLPAGGSANAQLVREYYAAVNAYIQTGHVADLRSFLSSVQSSGTGHHPPDGLIQLAALRASYPDLSFQVVAADQADDVVFAGISVLAGERALPDWKNTGAVESTFTVPVSIKLEPGNLVRPDGKSFVCASFLAVSKLDTIYRAAGAGRLGLIEILIDTPNSGNKLVPLPGPGVFAVESGELSLIGNGLVEVFTLSTLERATIPVGSWQVARPGDVVIIPTGRGVARIGGIEQARIIAYVHMPVDREKLKYFDRETVSLTDKSSLLSELLLAAEPGLHQTWFGEVEILSSSPQVSGSLWLSFESGSIGIPPGTALTLEAGHSSMVVEAGDYSEIVLFTQSGSDLVVRNVGPVPALVFVTRLHTADNW